jgi:FimV-like protein
MTPLDLARAYIESGGTDEALLNEVIDNENVANEIFGFHVQQALEKYLKAVLAVSQTRPQQTHDLGALLGDIAGLGYELPVEVSEGQKWTPFAVQNRYPFGMVSPAIDRAAALVLVNAVRAWATEILDKEESEA